VNALEVVVAQEVVEESVKCSEIDLVSLPKHHDLRIEWFDEEQFLKQK
jgi:hypothetical protein